MYDLATIKVLNQKRVDQKPTMRNTEALRKIASAIETLEGLSTGDTEAMVARDQALILLREVYGGL